jgi:cytochrome c oxidase subunit 4
MAHPEEAQRPYMKVFGYLAVVTGLEVLVTYLPIGKTLMILVLMAMAISKAALVAMYFMHLRYDRRILAIIATSPFVLVAILILALLPDIAFHR